MEAFLGVGGRWTVGRLKLSVAWGQDPTLGPDPNLTFQQLSAAPSYSVPPLGGEDPSRPIDR